MSNLVIIRNTDPDFYCLMGPFFGSIEVAKELGGYIWDFNNKVWIVYLKNGKVIGFCAIEVYKTNLKFCNMYVIKEHRGKGLGTLLMQERLKYCDQYYKNIRITITVKKTNTLKYYGFKVVKKLKNYTVYERN